MSIKSGVFNEWRCCGGAGWQCVSGCFLCHRHTWCLLRGVEEVVLTDSQQQHPARSWVWGMLLISDQLDDVVRVSQQRCSPFASVKRMSEGSLSAGHSPARRGALSIRSSQL